MLCITHHVTKQGLYSSLLISFILIYYTITIMSALQTLRRSLQISSNSSKLSLNINLKIISIDIIFKDFTFIMSFLILNSRLKTWNPLCFYHEFFEGFQVFITWFFNSKSEILFAFIINLSKDFRILTIFSRILQNWNF